MGVGVAGGVGTGAGGPGAGVGDTGVGGEVMVPETNDESVLDTVGNEVTWMKCLLVRRWP